MRQAILLLSTFILITYAFPAASQVTITESNFLRLASFTDSAHVVVDTGIPSPEGGANQAWDYSFLNTGIVGTTTYIDATADSYFTDALNYTNDNLVLNLGGFTYEVSSDLYEAVDANGWYRTGRSFGSQSVPLTSITGGANDRVDYLPNDSEYIGRIDIMKFPMTYQDQWNESYYYDLNYEVTAIAFGLNQTPAFTRTTVINDREVIGHGELIIPTPQGTPSAGMEVLLTKVVATEIDSFFLAGAPAPQMLLDALNLAQGVVKKDSFHVFYMPNFGAPVALFEFDENGMVDRVLYRTQAADLSTSSKELRTPIVNSFPNPVAAGSLITVSMGQSISSGQVRFFDLHGRLLHKATYDSIGGLTLQINVPASIPPGMLMYQVTDENNVPIGIGKLHVF